MYKTDLMPICVNRTGDKLKSVKGIIIHYVASAGGKAAAVRNNFIKWAEQETVKYASAHDIADLNGDILHIIPYDEAAWQVGRSDGSYTALKSELCGKDNPNYYFIGIEMCHPDETAKPTDETRAATVAVCADLCKQYGFTSADIYMHTEIVGADYKLCHLYYWNNPDAWAQFKADVDALLNPAAVPTAEDCTQELVWRGVISDMELWNQKAATDEDIRWLLLKYYPYIMTNGGSVKNPLSVTTAINAVSILKTQGIISDTELWMQKAATDEDIFWLLCKLTDYIN